MRNSLFIILLSAFQSFAVNGYAQYTRLSLDMKNSSVKEVLQRIEQQSEFYFLYNSELIDVQRKIDISVNNERIDEILNKVFSDGKVDILVRDRHIVLTAAGESASQQSRKISGKVTDSLGATLPGVSVVVKGTTIGVITDANGNYSISNLPENANLQFSFVGMKMQEFAIEGKTTINVKLEDETVGIEEVVAIGYGSQKKSNVIGSVSTVSNEQITTAPVSSVSSALAGRLPGAIIQQRSGEPGEDASSILIRGVSTFGNSAPLIVIDGIPGDLNSINANDVESISILKDASAAIYGARAANGVVLVNTKRGKEGTPATFKYSFYIGWLSPTHLPKMADAGTYAQMVREMESYKGTAESNMTYSLDDIEKYKSGKFPWTHPNTDWFDITLKKSSQTRNHDFSVSGGTKSVNYFVAFGTKYDDGLYKNSAKSFNRYNLRANVDIKVNEYLNIGIDLAGSQENRMGGTAPADLIFNVTNQNKPTTMGTFPNGLPGIGAFGPTYQPQLIGTFQSGFDDDKRFQSNDKINATFKIPGVDGLSLSSYYAYDVFFGKRKFFEKPVTAYTLDEGAYLAAGNTGSEDGSAFLLPVSDNFDPRLTDYYSNTTNKTFNFKVNYDKVFNNVHNISAFVAYESSDYNEEGITAYRRYFISSQLPYLFAGGNAEKDNSEYVNLDARVNYFGRISYNFKETYLFQFAFRRDGSLRFSKESGRWGNFPSFLAGWRVSNENFWKDNVNFINYFKLKASWGQMGNDQVLPFQYLASYAFGTGGVYGSNRIYSASLVQSNVPNPAITWEVAKITNVGFESQLFQNKVTLNADFFYQRRDHILIQRNASVPAFSGLSLPDENFGIVVNRGLEIQLGYNRKRNSDFSYSINGNFAFARNKIVEFDEPPASVPWQVLTGHPIGATLLYKSIGVFRDVAQINETPHVEGAIPGDIILEDVNKDGKINADDRILFDKTTNPEITYGLSFNVTYKSLTLDGLVYGAGIAWVQRLGSQQGAAGDYYQFSADGRWTPDNIDATKPRAYDGSRTYWRGAYLCDYEYQNQSYARLKSVQLSYSVPERYLNQIFIKDAQVYVSGQNLFLIYSSKNEIWDPEFSGSRDNYPLMKVFAIGARISF